MKLLIICSSLDLRQPYSCTPSWWQLLKGLAEAGSDISAVAYAGDSIESLWWKAYDNPCRLEENLFIAARAAIRRLPSKKAGRPANSSEGLGAWATRLAARCWVMPRWRAHLDGINRKGGPFDAVLVLTAPLNHLTGLPTYLRERFSLPTFYYDGDLPASLPRFQGFQSGFRIYQGADLSEYAGFVANSRGGAEELRAMGARNVQVLHYAADPTIFAPQAVAQDIDVFFYGHGAEYREEWISDMLAIPSERLSDLSFAVRGLGFRMPLGRVRSLPYLSVAKLREYCSRSRLNLVITRQAHASVYASSNARAFELAAMGATMVANPVLGVEEWFEPGKEIIVVNSLEEAEERYRWLISHERERRAIGKRAHRRFLAEHTYAHRARQLVDILKTAA
jgi:hypothetical protein